jgi:flagellar hook-length control protein FliK
VPGAAARAAVETSAPAAPTDAPASPPPGQPADPAPPSASAPAAPTAATPIDTQAPAQPAAGTQAQAASAAPAAPQFAGTPAPTHRAASLHRLPETMANLLHVSADRGITRARIALRPAELGGIEVQLAQTAAGITARLVADSPEAARMLAQAGEDLRRSLESRDVTLVSLEVTTSGEDRREAAAGHGAGPDSGQSREGRGDTGRDSELAASAEPVPAAIELPDGLLVDVLA